MQGKMFYLHKDPAVMARDQLAELILLVGGMVRLWFVFADWSMQLLC
jgi:hypothetical protein